MEGNIANVVQRSKSACLIFYLWTIMMLRTSSRTIRVVRSSANFSESIYSGEDTETTTADTKFLDLCIPEKGNSTTTRAVKEISSILTNLTVPTINYTINYSKLSDHFAECPTVNVELGCYIKLDNGSVIVPLYGRLFNDTDYIIQQNGELTICPEFYEEDSKFSPTLVAFSTAGIVISTICIILHMTMFLCLKNLRNLPGYCLFSLCISLLNAYICSFTTFVIPDKTECTATGMLIFYFFLASFFWMNVMSYDVWRSLRMATAKLRLTGDRPMFARFALYSAYSWGGPLVIVIISLIVNIANSDERYSLTFGLESCWFIHKQALQVYFAMPIYVLLLLNVILFTSSFIMISSATMNTVENKAVLWSRFVVSIRLATVMGLLWICSIIATSTEITAFWYIHSILNSLQGMFIFFSFSFTKKSIKECKRVITKKKSSIFPTQTSSSGGQALPSRGQSSSSRGHSTSGQSESAI